MTRRTFSKILVILILIPIAIRAWQRFSELGAPVANSVPADPPSNELQVDEPTDLSADEPAKRSDDE